MRERARSAFRRSSLRGADAAAGGRGIRRLGVRSSVGDSSAGTRAARRPRRRRHEMSSGRSSSSGATSSSGRRCSSSRIQATPNATTSTSTMSPTDSGRRAKSQSTASTAMIDAHQDALPAEPQSERAGVEAARGELTPRRGVHARGSCARKPCAGPDRPITQPRTAMKTPRSASTRAVCVMLPTSCS